jgi:hypothetical protein
MVELVTHFTEDTTTRVAAFYAFMTERENIRLRRSLGWPREEWTYDAVFREFSFTNVKREHDRTTTLLRRLYDEYFGEQMLEDFGPGWREDDYQNANDDLNRLLLNCVLYRYFGTIHSAEAIGWCSDWTHEERDRVIGLGRQGDLPFTAAYIVPNCGRSQPKYEIVCDIVDGVRPRIEEIVTQRSWEHQIRILKSCWGFGSFMAKEVLLDYILATQILPDDWQTWTPVGPGGCRGAGRVFTGRLWRLAEPLALEVTRKIYEMRSEYWRSDFVKLDLTDVQFQLCEYDKYSRVAEGRRPKRRFRPTVDAVTRGDEADALERLAEL